MFDTNIIISLAKENLRNDKTLVPVAFVLSLTKGGMLIPLYDAFKNEKTKGEFSESVFPNFLKQVEALHVVIVSEAWTWVSEAKNSPAHIIDVDQIKRTAQRTEALFVVSISKHAAKSEVFPFTREKDEIVFGDSSSSTDVQLVRFQNIQNALLEGN